MIPPVALFRWTGDLPAEPTGSPRRLSGDDGEQLTFEASYPAAVALAAALRDGAVSDDDLWEGELGWHFEIAVASKTVHLFLLWTAIEYPPHHYIAVQWHVRRSAREWLLRRRPSPAVLETAQNVIDRAIRSLTLATDVQWLSDESFAASYCRGAALVGRARASKGSPTTGWS